ncbi:hypothetical protein KIN20_008727 [Parelaphostrongylus tenuis]|uniref:Receptor ligand binding region domain-containing protein n=1 Tax=Parelaphostrongylus tenuis TaxID=148309 RepID=A0AAD5MN59_PARTN|nr:hypothetical protein KIN20_008727 [Parelaphostrongylus tenuis]
MHTEVQLLERERPFDENDGKSNPSEEIPLKLPFISYKESAINESASSSVIRKHTDNYRESTQHITFYTIRFDECDEKLAIGISTELILDDNIDVIIGPTCAPAAQVAAINAVYYNIPIFTWGLSTSYALSDIVRYPTVGVLSVTSYSLGIAIKSVLSSLKWKQVAFLYSTDGDKQKCSTLKNDMQDAFSDMNDVVITIIVEIKKITFEDITHALGDVSLRARIVVVCLAEGFGYKRTFILAAKDTGFLNGEYVYIFADTKSKGFYVPLLGGKERPIWDDVNIPNDGRDAEALAAFEQTLVVSDAAAYAGELFDCVYVYARALNSTLKKNATAYRNGTTIIENIEMTFDGMSGIVKMGKNGVRIPIFYLDGLGKSGKQVLLATISVDGDTGCVHLLAAAIFTSTELTEFSFMSPCTRVNQKSEDEPSVFRPAPEPGGPTAQNEIRRSYEARSETYRECKKLSRNETGFLKLLFTWN